MELLRLVQLEKENFAKDEIIELLSQAEKEDEELIRKTAYEIMRKNCGEKVYLRGLIEFSNICVNDCYYCGIRKSNENVKRYFLKEVEVIEIAKWCADKGFGSLVLQSGERTDIEFINFIIKTVKEIKKITVSENLPAGLGVTLCVGEQKFETYQKFFDAGVHRYLLRIETSSPELFRKIHPENISFEKRLDCLKMLKEIGYQVGTGVMIGLPGQTIEDLANDILFFKKMNIDMLGMGPYIVHEHTPMNEWYDYYNSHKEEIYKLALRMIAIARIVLKDVNIASTTALQAMNGLGREEGLMHGANVIMPLLTPAEVRKDYVLYDGKPCLDEFSGECFGCVIKRIESLGRKVGFNDYGDSMHFFQRIINQ